VGLLGDQIRGDAAQADQLEASHVSCQTQLTQVEAELDQANAQIADLKAQLAECQAQLPKTFDLAAYCRGVWALKQVTTSSSIDAGDITIALQTPGVRGFAARFPWSSIGDEHGALLPGPLDAARTRADAAGVELSVRFMAGRYLPAALYDAMGPDYLYTLATQDPGARVPLPFSREGIAGNPAFEDAYARLVGELSSWCRANEVHLLHLPWYGRLWAEYNADADIQAVPGWAVPNCVEGNLSLLSVGRQVSGDDLAVSFTSSGLFSGGVGQQITDANRNRMLELWGPGSAQIQTLLTGLGQYQDVGQVINPGGSQDIYDGEQMYDGTSRTDYVWADLFSTCFDSGINWIEVYAPSFTYTGSQAWQAPALAAAIAAFNTSWGI
jgi:hypothetical protein